MAVNEFGELELSEFDQFFVGVISGCLLSAILWLMIGVVIVWLMR